MKKRLVIYHAKCRDGFTAAWAAWRLFGDVETDYLPASYGDEPPDLAGREEVLIVDFSYPRAVLLVMAMVVSLEVFDHHKTAEADLAGLPFAVFDPNRSGAGLTWDRLHKTPRPWLVNYVEDRDLWRFALPRSKEVNAWIGASPSEAFSQWDDLELLGVAMASDRGEAVLTFIDRMVHESTAHARTVFFEGHNVPIVNAGPGIISELLNVLAETAAFAIGWFQRGDGFFIYSLRSSRDGVDVSEIAKRHGGGGHRNAAGFQARDRLEL